MRGKERDNHKDGEKVGRGRDRGYRPGRDTKGENKNSTFLWWANRGTFRCERPKASGLKGPKGNAKRGIRTKRGKKI